MTVMTGDEMLRRLRAIAEPEVAEAIRSFIASADTATVLELVLLQVANSNDGLLKLTEAVGALVDHVFGEGEDETKQ